MALVLGLIGIVLLVAAIRGQSAQLFALVKSDFQGQDNFVYWLTAILLIGAVGYIPRLRPVSTALLALVLVVLFLKNGGTTGTAGGFFANLTSGLASTQTAQQQPASSTATASTGNPLSGFLKSVPSISSLVH